MSTVIMTESEVLGFINKIYKGDEKAEIYLMKAYSEALPRYIRKRFEGMLNTDEIDDIVSDTWLKVIERLKKPDGRAAFNHEKGKFSSYLISEAKFKALKVLKYKFNTIDIEGTDENGELAINRLPASADDNTENAVMGRMDRKQKLRAYKAFLSIIFLCGGHLYQQLAFTFSRLLLSEASDRSSAESRLEVIYGELRRKPFKEVYTNACEGINIAAGRFALMSSEIIGLMRPMEERLPVRLSELLSGDRNRTLMFNDFSDLNAEDTCFENYFKTKDGLQIEDDNQISKTVSGWLDKLDGRVRVVLGAKDARDKAVGRTTGMVVNGGIEYEKVHYKGDRCNSCQLIKLKNCN